MRIKGQKDEALNPQQLAAVQASLDKPVVVLAGPGSGKTTVIKHRLQWMIGKMGIAPHQIIAVTFTSNMATELADRLNGAGVAVPERQISTIHAFALRTLNRLGIKMGKTKDWKIRAEIQTALDRMNWKVTARSVRWWIDRSKQDGVLQKTKPLTEYFTSKLAGQITPKEAGQLAEIAVSIMRMQDTELTLTYVDMVNELWQQLQNPEVLAKVQGWYKYVLVDEGQDTFELAIKILRKIAPEHFFIVGDSDQMLFRFSGSSPEINLYATAENGGQVFKLETNYRSLPRIVKAANSLIAANYKTDEFKKTLVAAREDDGMPAVFYRESVTGDDEMQWVVQTIKQQEYKPQSCFISVRTNAQLGIVERHLADAGIPLVLLGATGFFSRPHIQTVMAYLRLATNLQDDESFERIYNISSRDFTNRAGQYIPHRYLGNVFLGGLKRRGESYYKGLLYGDYDSRFKSGARDLVDMLGRLAALKAASPKVVLREAVEESFLPHYAYENGISAADPSDDDSVVADLAALKQFAEKYATVSDFIEFVDGMIKKESSESDRAISVVAGTGHRLKGQERPVMFALGWSEGLLPHRRSYDDAVADMAGRVADGLRELPILTNGSVADERCVAYVILTRAMNRVYISSIERWGEAELRPSRFISELGIFPDMK